MKATGAKILLVDDEPDILEIVGYNLKNEGYQVFTASSGKEGVAIAKEVKPDLILLDVMMPEMDGIEACDQIRRVPALEGTIIAFLTARGEDYSQVAGFEAGAGRLHYQTGQTESVDLQVESIATPQTYCGTRSA